MTLLTIESLQSLLKPVFQKHHVQRAFVFGSVARGEATRRSDIDLIAIQETEKRFLDRGDGIYGDVCDIIHGCGVDLLIYTPEEFEQLPNTAFIRRMLQESKVIYEREREPSTSTYLA